METGDLKGSPHIGAALVAIGRATARLLTEGLQSTGLKPRHLRVLGQLSNGPLTQQALSDAIGMDATQLVVVLNELEEARLVTRRRDRDDRRRHIVRLSFAGSTRFAEAERLIRAVEQVLLAGIDPQEIAQTLTRIADNVGISVDCGSADTEEDDPGGC